MFILLEARERRWFATSDENICRLFDQSAAEFLWSRSDKWRAAERCEIALKCERFVCSSMVWRVNVGVLEPCQRKALESGDGCFQTLFWHQLEKIAVRLVVTVCIRGSPAHVRKIFIVSLYKKLKV